MAHNVSYSVHVGQMFVFSQIELGIDDINWKKKCVVSLSSRKEMKLIPYVNYNLRDDFNIVYIHKK